MRWLRVTMVFAALATTLVNCGDDASDEDNGGNGADSPDGSVEDAAARDAAQTDEDSGSTANGGSGGAGGSGGQGGEGTGGGANDSDASMDACPDTEHDAHDTVGTDCSGSDVCVYPGVQLPGVCTGTYVTACASGTWTSQCYAASADAGPLECNDLDGPDAGAQAMRECSDSVTRPVLWAAGTLTNGQPSCGPIPQQMDCMLPWGCGSFDTARDTLAQCNGGPLVTAEQSARGWGFLILEDHLGLIVRRGYYDETTGALVGTWSREGLDELCAGTVPTQSLYGPTTDHVALCLPDGGVIGGGTGDGG